MSAVAEGSLAPGSPGDVAASAARLAAEYSEAVEHFLARADRTSLKASVFNVPKRTEITLPVYAGLAPGFFRAIAEQATPEQLGASMRRVGMRPTALHLGGVFWQTMLERERRLGLGLDPLPADDTAWVLDWVGRALEAQRLDGSAFPGEANGWNHRILEPSILEPLVDGARSWGPAEIKDLRFMTAALELYSFMLHGEHRDGITDHGPYPLGNGEIAMVKDVTDLQSDFLPWATADVHLPHPSVSVVLVLDEAAAPQLNWAGTVEYSGEPHEHLRRAAVYVTRDGVSVPLASDEWRPLGAAAQRAQRSLFVSAVGWPEDEKVTYGSWLFANHLQEIPRALGLDPTISEVMVKRFIEEVQVEYATIDMSVPSPVWGLLRRTPPFTPLGEDRR